MRQDVARLGREIWVRTVCVNLLSSMYSRIGFIVRYCLYVLRGHTGTIRCLKVLHNRPIAVTGSRDATLRVWDVQLGGALRTLEGHRQSVRCLDVCGNKVVSGSYDATCRVGHPSFRQGTSCFMSTVNRRYGILTLGDAFTCCKDTSIKSIPSLSTEFALLRVA
jgi:WD40 repeat protein